MTVRTRFAPSPTGFMHIGGVRTALFAWLYARKHKGQFLLRIEDTDQEREVEGSAAHIIECLRWLGLNYDEGPDVGGTYGPYYQSERLTTYRKYADQLIAAGFAYPDPYTEEQVEEWRAQAEKDGKPFLYRDHRPETMDEWDGTRPLRFKVPNIKRFTWADLARGELSAGEEALDDFILIKSDGYPTYNFAHVVDDIEMKITHVMRGEEFISSTPKFLSLYEALDMPPPAFVTMPVILGPDGKKKLSKRDGAKDLLAYRDEGYLPQGMRNFLALIGWNPGTEEEIMGDDELMAAFELEKIHKSPAALDEQKLLHINREWMRRLDDSEYLKNLLHGSPRSTIDGGEISKTLVERALPLLRERASTFKEAREMLQNELSCLFLAPNPDVSKLIEKSSRDETHNHLYALSAQMESLSANASVEEIKNSLMSYADTITKESGGRGAALWPLRYALSGQERSPDPFSLIHILGKDEALRRVLAAVSRLA